MANCLDLGRAGQLCANTVLTDKVFIFSREKKSVATKTGLTLAVIEGWVEDGSVTIVKADHVVPAQDEVVTEQTTFSTVVTGYTAGLNTFSINNPSDRIVNNAVTGSSLAGDYYVFTVSANNVFTGRRSATDAKVFEMSPIRIIKLPKTKGGDGVGNKANFQYSYTDVYGENYLSSTYAPADFSIADLLALQVTDITFVNQASTIATGLQLVAYDYDMTSIISSEITTTNIVVTNALGAPVVGTWTLTGDVLVFSETLTAQTYTVSGDFVTDRFNLPAPISVVIAS